MRSRVLLVITVFDAPAAVRRCLDSAAAIRTQADLAMLVLDDCSPAPGWSSELRELCETLGLEYYRPPRNLGIVRNVNLGLGAALARGYEGVIVSNSDVVYPTDLVDRLRDVASSDANIGSVTAWSNNVSIYSLPNADPGAQLASQVVVNEVSGKLANEFGDEAVDIPAGISFCMYIKTSALRSIGVMDPIFGRGYCEETDWSRRSLQRGHRVVLAPGVFVYHQGRASTLAAGLVSGKHTSVAFNDSIIDHRYPDFAASVARFRRSGIHEDLTRRGTAAIVAGGAAIHGYEVHITRHASPGAHPTVRCLVDPSRRSPVVADHLGFRCEVPIASGTDLLDGLAAYMRGMPRRAILYDDGAAGARTAEIFRRRAVPVVIAENQRSRV